MEYSDKRKCGQKGGDRPPLHIWLAYLLVCTLTLTGVSFAKYTTSTSGSDSARVAAFAVTAGSDQNGAAFVIDPSDESTLTQEYKFTVSNYQNGTVSEVETRYTVTVTLDQYLPSHGLSITVDGNEPSILSDGSTYTCTFYGSLSAAVEQTNTHILKFTGNTSASATDTPINVNVSVHAEQID